MRPTLPPGWSWDWKQGTSHGQQVGGPDDGFTYDTDEEAAKQAWVEWTRVSGITREAWEALNQRPRIELTQLEGGGMAILVHGGRLTEGSVKSLKKFIELIGDHALVLELED